MEYYHTFTHSMGDRYTVSNPDCSKIVPGGGEKISIPMNPSALKLIHII